MSAAPVFVDVNVLMYAAGQEHAYKESCPWLMTEFATGFIDAVIDTEIIQEVLYRYGALRKWALAVAVSTSVLEIFLKIFPIQPDDTRVAIQLFDRYAPRGIMARELIHVAVMKNNGIESIISTDKHFDQIEGITRLDPMNLLSQLRQGV